MNIAVQPYASAAAQIHFRDTVMRDVLLSDIRAFLTSEDQAILQNSYPDGKLKVWGITANRQQKQWDKLSVGDRVFFYANKKFAYQATVTHKLSNPQLAEFLWGKTEDDQATWENIYFIAGLSAISLEIKAYNRFLGYKENYFVQAFYVHSEEQSELLWEGLKAMKQVK